MTDAQDSMVWTVTAADGVELVYERQAALEPKALLLHIHGLGINRAYVRSLAGQLAKQGIVTYAPDLRGHGTSGGERGFVDDYRLFLSDIRHVIEDIRRQEQDLPLFLSGLSLGALIALGTAMAYPRLLQGVIALAPVFVDRYLSLPLKLAMLSKIGMGNLIPSLRHHPYPTALKLDLLLCSNPAGRELMTTDPHRQDDVTAKLYWEILRLTVYLSRHPHLLGTPLLLLLAGDDRVGQNWASRRFFRAVSLADKALVEYPGYGHDLVLEYHEGRVATDISKWISCRC